MHRICLVEDEQSLAEMIKMNLELEGNEVVHYINGINALEHLKGGTHYDLIILDVMLPGMNGVELCKQLRLFSMTPILFLSAKGTTSDRIEGLKAGGNDYLPKPFDLEELLLRVSILMKSSIKDVENSVQIGDWEVDFKTFEVKNLMNNKVITLSKKEIGLIQLFTEKEGEVVSRSEILDRVWGKDQFPTSRTIDNYILNFRKIFELDQRNPAYFHSIRGVGYKFTN